MAAPNYSNGDQWTGLYGYEDPSIPAASFCLAGFIIIAIVHMWLLRWHQAWLFWGMYVGILMECIGFGFRTYSLRNPDHEPSFNASYVTILSAPAFMTIGCFATFSRIVWWITPLENHQFRILWCHPRTFAPVLIALGLISALGQLIGSYFFVTTYGNMYVTSREFICDITCKEVPHGSMVALNATRIALVLQSAIIVIFVVVGTRFAIVSRRWRDRSLPYAPDLGANWSRLNWAVYSAVIAILIRTGYRISELFTSIDTTGYLADHEWPFWVCDAVPMLSVSILFISVSPGYHLPVEFLGIYLDKSHVRSRAKNVQLSNDASVLMQSEGNNHESAQRNWV